MFPVTNRVCFVSYVGDIGEGEEGAVTKSGTVEMADAMVSGGVNNPESFGEMIPFGDPMWYQDWYS